AQLRWPMSNARASVARAGTARRASIRATAALPADCCSFSNSATCGAAGAAASGRRRSGGYGSSSGSRDLDPGAKLIVRVSEMQCAAVSARTRRIRGVTLTLLHNPHCSTSVHALEALEAAGRPVTVRRYLLKAERLDEAELRSLAERIQGDPPDALIRRDKKYKQLGLEADGMTIDEVVAILVEHPALLQRPILDDGTAAMIGRPRSRAAAWAAARRVS